MIEIEKFGSLNDGREVTLYKITNSGGAYITVSNYGGAIVSVCVPDKNGKLTDVCLGYETPQEYAFDGAYLGKLVGRCANRIANGEFTLNGRKYTLAVNNGPNHLHGGTVGFSDKILDCECGAQSVTFTLLSPDGEEGYPANLKLTAEYRFTDSNEIILTYNAVSDGDTVVNITNHAYFDLNGQGSGKAMEQKVKIHSRAFAEINENMIPTGNMRKIENGDAFDFSDFKCVGRDISDSDNQLKLAGGYDHSFSVDGDIAEKYGTANLKRAAEVIGESTGIKMDIFTTKPAMQMYTANFLTERKGKNGKKYGVRDGIAFETQHFPDAVNQSVFPSPVIKANEVYEHTTIYKFSNF